MWINNPLSLDPFGHVTQADDPTHIRQMILQVLFTAPGERVNMPDFGCGLAALVFESATSERIGINQAMIQASLLRWMGELIRLDALQVTPDGEKLSIRIAYTILATGHRIDESIKA